MNLLWAFDISLPKDPGTGLPISLDGNGMTDVCFPASLSLCGSLTQSNWFIGCLAHSESIHMWCQATKFSESWDDQVIIWRITSSFWSVWTCCKSQVKGSQTNSLIDCNTTGYMLSFFRWYSSQLCPICHQRTGSGYVIQNVNLDLITVGAWIPRTVVRSKNRGALFQAVPLGRGWTQLQCINCRTCDVVIIPLESTWRLGRQLIFSIHIRNSWL